MKLTSALPRGRLAARIFLSFVLAALVPIGATAWLALSQTARVLTDEAREQVRVSAKAFGMSVYGNLKHAKSEMQEIGRRLQKGVPIDEALDPADIDWHKAIALRRASQANVPLFGDIEELALLAERAAQEPAPRQVKLLWLAERPGAVFMALPLASAGPGAEVLISELNSSYLWNAAGIASSTTRLCVLDGAGNPVHCPDGLSASASQRLRAARAESSTGQLQWERGDEHYLGSYWDLFLATEFPDVTWTIVASESMADTLHAVADFQRQFPRVVLLSVLLVTFLSVFQIRRTLIPLQGLMDGIRRIAKGDFKSRLQIHSSDEFQELGAAFDAMTERIEHQFNAMSALSRVDHAILSTRQLDPTLQEILRQAPDIVQCDFASLILADLAAPPAAVAYTLGSASDSRDTELQAEDAAVLQAHPKGLLLAGGDSEAAYLSGLQALGAEFVFAAPVLLAEQLRGILAFGYRARPSLGEEERTQAAALADRVALAVALEDWQRRLYEQAHYDSLTWLPNRRLFTQQIQEETERARRSETKIAVLFIDLDHFKNINDSLGHAAGDTLLQQAAARLRRCVGDMDKVARLGGDEFAVILTDIQDARDAGRLAREIVHDFSVPFTVVEREVFVGATIGIAISPDDGESWQELLKNADTALYKAKAEGRNDYAFFRPEMDAQAWERMVMQSELRRALQRGELFLEYQPQLEIGSDLVVGAEALVRWHHPERGLFTPGQFIPLAEEIGLIVPIGEWVLVEACRQYLEWAAAGSAPRRIAVNISAHHLQRPGFIPWLRATLKDIEMPPDCLELEITESVLIEDIGKVATTLEELRGMGVRLAIDDFGTKYSSLGYLKSFHVDVLKLDRSFVCDVATNQEAAGIVKAVAEVAHVLKLEVLAEGVETKEQLASLQELHCDQVQGYYFSKPVAPAAFARFARRHGLGSERKVTPMREAKLRYG